jgi:hypothetical protein
MVGEDLYSRRHLPQGAPTSPGLANRRLAGLAKSSAVEYTCYSDDVAFSGGLEFARRADRFSLHAAAILLEEGFVVQHRKTRIMQKGVQQYLAGPVVNQRLNVSRDHFDRLKAILADCVR